MAFVRMSAGVRVMLVRRMRLGLRGGGHSCHMLRMIVVSVGIGRCRRLRGLFGRSFNNVEGELVLRRRIRD